MELEWSELFAIGVSPLELFVRGTAMYWFLFLIFRTVLRRDVGSIGIADILLLVIIADAAQNAMSGEYETITDGFFLVATIAGWNWLTDWLSWRFPRVRRIMQPSELVLVRDGNIQYRSLRKEMITEADLMAKLREHGVQKLDEVKRAYMESDGAITVLKYRAQRRRSAAEAAAHQAESRGLEHPVEGRGRAQTTEDEQAKVDREGAWRRRGGRTDHGAETS